MDGKSYTKKKRKKKVVVGMIGTKLRTGRCGGIESEVWVVKNKDQQQW